MGFINQCITRGHHLVRYYTTMGLMLQGFHTTPRPKRKDSRVQRDEGSQSPVGCFEGCYQEDWGQIGGKHVPHPNL